MSDVPIASPTTEQFRRRWACHVTSPGFVRSPCGTRIEESFVGGQHVSELDDEAQVLIIRRILEMHRDLAHAEAGAPSAGLRSGMGEAMKDSPSVLGPRTASVDNIVVMEGSEPVFIDVYPLVEMPFYGQPLRVLRNWERISDRPMRLVRTGVFDREIRELLTAGGLRVPPGVRPGEFFLRLPVATTPLPELAPAGPS